MAASQFNGAPRFAEPIERCPALVGARHFTWRLNGTLIEAKCAGRPTCGVTTSACPIVNGPSSEWGNLMLGKYATLDAVSERSAAPAAV